ncbi:unnamed protein product [Trichobilharzia szidati]|nr:unnamed protein product [Trichobilharzia szidati]
MDLSDEDLSPLINQTSTSTSVHKREPNAEERKLTKLLIERVLPPFSKSLKLQALVAYQADHEKMKCLLVNQTYEKSNNQSFENDSPNHDLSDSGIMDTSTAPNSPIKTDQEIFKDDNTSIPRRKRKLSRPCKIPQNTPIISEPIESSPSTLNNSNNNNNNNTSTNPLPVPLQKQITEVITPIKSGTTNGLFMPVSAVTLLPHVSVFSLPVTVLSTVPRPILPRICADKQPPARPVNNYNLQTLVSSPLKNTTITTTMTTTTTTNTTIPSNSPPKNSSKESSNSSEESNSVNRRYAKSFVCNQCRKPFNSLSLLCDHTFSVHKAFKCTICGAQFTQRSNLQRHSLRHVGFKPFVCKICDKSYYRKDHLVRHIELTHPGCDPRTNLTVKLSSAECLDYLDQIQKHDDKGSAEQVQILCNNSMDNTNNNDSGNNNSNSINNDNDISKITNDIDENDIKLKICLLESTTTEKHEPQTETYSPTHPPCTSVNS